MEYYNSKYNVDDLIEINKEIKLILNNQKIFLDTFRKEDGTYFHQKNNGNINLTSTITCINSLIESKLDQDIKKDELYKILLNQKWQSAELEENNCYTSSLMLYGLKRLKNQIDLNNPDNKKIVEQLEQIKENINNNGGLKVKDYPRNSFLTFWGFLSYKAFYGFQKTIQELSNGLKWLEQELYHQISCFYSDDVYNKDIYQLGYSLITLLIFEYDLSTPIVDKVFELIFSDQREDGSWDKYNPLFHYPGAGNAYCFSFELLKSFFLNPEKFERKLENFIKNFERARRWIENHLYIGKKDDETSGWCSYHHPNWKKPESWATACVFDFLRGYKNIIENLIRRRLLTSLNAQKEFRKDYWNDVLKDIDIKIDNNELKLKSILLKFVIDPIKNGRNKNAVGILFYGPPGTGKTLYAKSIAQELEWPLIVLNPSSFLTEGFAGIVRNATLIVNKLKFLENAVVLFDEMDELIRARGREAQYETRLFTTSMLPMISDLHDKENFVYIFNTNNYKGIDEASIRPGRFDLSLYIGPPCIEEKLKIIEETINKIGISDKKKQDICKIFNEGVKKKIIHFSYHRFLDLCENIKKLIESVSDDQNLILEIQELISKSHENAKKEFNEYKAGIDKSKIHFL